VTSKRRKGFSSETNVKRGLRFVRGGEKELVEKLGREDPCPCGSGRRFQALLLERRPFSTAARGRIIGADEVGAAFLAALPASAERDRSRFRREGRSGTEAFQQLSSTWSSLPFEPMTHLTPSTT
jgi:hypothetical protein